MNKKMLIVSIVLIILSAIFIGLALAPDASGQAVPPYCPPYPAPYPSDTGPCHYEYLPAIMIEPLQTPTPVLPPE